MALVGSTRLNLSPLALPPLGVTSTRISRRRPAVISCAGAEEMGTDAAAWASATAKDARGSCCWCSCDCRDILS
jgi:hypothetical protein